MWIVGKFHDNNGGRKNDVQLKTGSSFFRERIVFCSGEYLDGLSEYER